MDKYYWQLHPVWQAHLFSSLVKQREIECDPVFYSSQIQQAYSRWRLPSRSLARIPNFDWSEKQYWMYQIFVSAILRTYLFIYLFKMFVFLWMGWFYRMRRNNFICSIILPNCKTMGAFTQISLPADNWFHTDEILDSLFTRNLSCWLWFKI